MITLGIDAGASSTRWVLLRDGARIAEGTAGPMTGHLYGRDAIDRMAETLERMSAEIRSHARPDRVMAGISGLTAATRAADLYHRYLSTQFKLDRQRVTVTNDMEIAYRSAFAPGEGILVYAGTGSIAYHLRADGTAERAGGYGYLIDDAGGGFWIGQQAIRAVMRAHDRNTLPTPLSRALFAQIGGDTWDVIRAHVYGGGRQAIAAFVPAVLRADGEGDQDAKTILRGAGEELAHLAQIMFARVGPKPVALTGGVPRAAHMVVAAFRASPGLAESRVIDGANAHTAAVLAAAHTS